MNVSMQRGLFSWFSFWIVLALLCCYILWPLRQTLRYGIDLVGGTFITLEVQTDKAVESELLSKMQAITNKLKSSNSELVGKKVEKNSIVLEFLSPTAAQNASMTLQSMEKDLKLATNNQIVTLTLPDRLAKRIKDDAVNRNVEVLRNRLNKLSVEEITIAAQGEKNIIVELPDVSDPQQAKAMIGKAALLEFKLVQKVGKSIDDILYEIDGILPGDMEILPDQEVNGNPTAYYLVSKYAEVTGKDLKDARAELNPQTMKTGVAFSLTSEGGEKFAELTGKNIGKDLAIVLDGVVNSAPRIQSKIQDAGSITGNYTPDTAKQLASLLKSGAFVAPVTFEEERQVGPSLGAESIRKGLMSCIIGLLLLLIFSVSFYSLSGVLAFITLIFNLLLILVAMHFLNATLTLPGIAGLVLTVGMAIDASILIYEQIKEALASGMTIKKAVSTGFSDALVVILDANITTFIVGVVLYYFGTGPIRGFAVTMMLGIVSTLITGLFFLKSMFTFILNTFNVQKLRI